MARIAGVDIPNNKRVEIALTYIYGLGRKSANDILAQTGVDPDKRAKDLTEDEIAKLRDVIENQYTVEGASGTAQDKGAALFRHTALPCRCFPAPAAKASTASRPPPRRRLHPRLPR